MISVILPVHNGSSFIEAAIHSVFNQNMTDYELIIINDGSTDATAEIISKLNIPHRLIDQENGGPANARNSGIKIAKGEYIAFIDADDLWPTGKLDAQLKFLNNNPTFDLVWGKSTCLFEKPELRNRYATIVQTAFFGPLLGAGLFRKKVVEEVGYFNEKLIFAEDVDWHNRIKEKNMSVHYSDEVSLLYRIHENNMTANTKDVMQGTLKAIKYKLDRNRINGK